MIAKRSRQQIEQHIAKCAESIRNNGLEIGRDLIEIRDNELWSDEYDSWNKYLKERATELVGKSFVQSVKFIRAAEISGRLPSKIDVDLTPSHLVEIGRLAPNKGKDTGGKEKDYSKLRKQDVARVIKAAAEIADSDTPSVRDIRKAVDDELGIDRAAERMERKRHNEKLWEEVANSERNRKQAELEWEEEKRELGNYLAEFCHRLREAVDNFREVPGEGWEELQASKPGLCELVAQAADELSGLMRSKPRTANQETTGAKRQGGNPNFRISEF